MGWICSLFDTHRFVDVDKRGDTVMNNSSNYEKLDDKGKICGAYQVGEGLLVAAVIGVLIKAVMYMVDTSGTSRWVVYAAGIVYYLIMETAAIKTDYDKVLSWKMHLTLTFSVGFMLVALYLAGYN